jgi:hypothetical protein
MGTVETSPASPDHAATAGGAAHRRLFNLGPRSDFAMTLDTHSSITESHRASLRAGIDDLRGHPFDHESPLICTGRLHLLLEALPLDTTEFGLAVNRLKNAQHYMETGEHGAARFKLRLLRQSLGQ